MSTTTPKRVGRRPNSETTPVIASPESEANSLPEFIRLPKAGYRCAWTGLSRGSINDLILGPDAPVQSVLVKQPGASRGVRLVHLGSLLDFLYAQMEAQSVDGIPEKEVHHA